MSIANPTPLRVGAKGTLHGWSVTVAGRVVLGVEVGGERFFWNEYHLVDGAGNSGTLVYEETDDGPEWKLFQLLTPRQPMPVSEAEVKKVGDRVSFGGAAIPITLVDRSTVHHIEGTAPEGVEVGDLADFFNADAGDHMIVASWTGNEIEFYEGRDVPAEVVATAFGLPRGAPGFRTTKLHSGSSQSPGKQTTGIVLAVLAVVGLIAANSCFSRKPTMPAAGQATVRRPSQTAPTLRLTNGTSGVLGARTYTIGGHALVGVGRIAGKYDRHEYHLTGENQGSALLINGLNGGTRQWHLLQPVAPPANFTAYDAAAQRKGRQLNLGGVNVTITELFLSQPRAVDGTPAAGIWPVEKNYGFVATSPGEWWVARWTERGLSLHRGAPLDEASVFAALGPGPEKPK